MVKIRIFSGLDINRSKFNVLSCAFDGISKFGSTDPEFADLLGRVGSPGGVIFDHLEKFNDQRVKKV